MAQQLINRDFYDAILRFEEDETAQDYYYKVMDTVVERDGKKSTVRKQILRAYAMLFCDDLDMRPGQEAGFEEVEATAEQHHFPVIDEDNYDRFAALVIADLRAGPLRDAAVNGGDMLLVGGLDPLHMTREEREHQDVRVIRAGGGS